MKHVKLEFSEEDYEVVKEAAYQSRLPIKRYCQQKVTQAAEKDGKSTPPAPPKSQQ